MHMTDFLDKFFTKVSKFSNFCPYLTSET